MSETKKEGPWFAVQPEDANGWWVVARDKEGCDTVDDSADGGFTEPVARLIAAAPDLLDALMDLVEAGSEAWGDERPCVRIAREAIAKATGQTP